MRNLNIERFKGGDDDDGGGGGGDKEDKKVRRVMRPLAMVYCVAIVVIYQIQIIYCSPDVEQRRQLGSSNNNQGQAAGFGDFISPSSSSAGSSSNLVDAMIMNLGAGQQNGGYLNNKRARKMSAFMPMRGRKDGRDSSSPAYSSSSVGNWQQQQPFAYLPTRESDESDASILRLAMEAAVANQALGGATGIAATPRSFVDQMAARRVQQHQQQQPQGGGGSNSRDAGNGGGEVVFEPGTNSLVFDPSTQTNVMQAKLRRAFHPMRGKKSFDPSLSELFADQFKSYGEQQQPQVNSEGIEMDM